MALTVLGNLIMPNSVIAAGVRGKNMRMNSRSKTQGGFDSINVIWTKTLRQYEVGIAPMTIAQWEKLQGLHELTEGGAYGFLMEDPSDNQATTQQGYLYPTGLSDELILSDLGFSQKGYGMPRYQIRKYYTVLGSGLYALRDITRPKSSIKIFRDGVAVDINTSTPGSVEIDYETGIVIFVADYQQDIVSITTGSTTTINFISAGTDIVLNTSAGMLVYIDGVSGTAASVLNGMYHHVTSVSSTSITIDTNTSGKSGSDGLASLFPQQTEELSWSGGFYVPVHFMEDSIDWEIVRSGPYDQRLVTGPSVGLLEVRE